MRMNLIPKDDQSKVKTYRSFSYLVAYFNGGVGSSRCGLQGATQPCDCHLWELVRTVCSLRASETVVEASPPIFVYLIGHLKLIKCAPGSHPIGSGPRDALIEEGIKGRQKSANRFSHSLLQGLTILRHF